MQNAAMMRGEGPYAVLPRPPDLTAGVCLSGKLPADWWTSDDPAERKAAISACRQCPVLAQCREWCLNLPVPRYDVTIYGGWTSTQRAKANTQARAETEAARLAAERQAAAERLAARRPECSKGHDLRPGQPNLIMFRDKQGYWIRRCRECQRRAGRDCEKLRRQLGKAPASATAQKYAANPEPYKRQARAYYAEHAEQIKAKRRAERAARKAAAQQAAA
jgi:hypothetical protein